MKPGKGDMAPPTAADQVTIGRILKVNHAGEYGAIRIYRAQLAVAKAFWPDMRPFLEETLGHEIRHCARFRDAMPTRGARPCRAMWLWGHGGLLLGLATACLGRQGVWICTEAVEQTVHRHLEDQLAFLRQRDAGLHDVILDIQTDELAHLSHASARITRRAPWKQALGRCVEMATEVVIWLATQGESSRMAADLANRGRPSG